MAGADAAGSPQTLEVRNPRTGRCDYTLRLPEPAWLGARCAELRTAQQGWWLGGVERRAHIMRRWADAIEAHQEPLIAALATDTGRRTLAEGEVASAARNIRRWCARAPALVGSQERQSELVPTLRYRHQFVPYPLVGVISPWNFPLALSLIDSVAALLAGCAVLVKPSEVTPRFAEPLRATIEAVAELAGVLEVVPGDGRTGAALVGQVDAICFTGSVPTGRRVAVAAAERFIPAFLELGGKDPAIVLPSADLDAAVDAILRGAVLATGQVCLSLERVYVHTSIHDAFVARLVAAARQVELNYPDIRQGSLGPIIHGPQAAIIDAHLADAVARGAAIRCGGPTEELGGGRYCRATVVTGVNHSMRLMTEETFGPVMPVMAYRTVDEAVALANDSDYGLSAAVFAGTAAEALAVAERVNAGGVSINDSALTRETYEAEKNSFGYSGLGGSRMGDAGLLRFLRRKALLIQTGRPARLPATG